MKAPARKRFEPSQDDLDMFANEMRNATEISCQVDYIVRGGDSPYVGQMVEPSFGREIVAAYGGRLFQRTRRTIISEVLA